MGQVCRRIDALVPLAGDVDVLVVDFVDLIDRRNILTARKEVAQRLVGEILRIVTTIEDCRCSKLRYLALDLDVEIVDRKAELRVAKETEVRRKDDADNLRFRRFSFKIAQAALREGGRRDSATLVIVRNAVSGAVICNALARRAVGKPGTIIDAGIEALVHEARFVSKELLEERGSAERGAVAATETEPIGYGPVETQLVGEITIVFVGHAVRSARRFDIRESARRRKRKVFEEHNI